jgi:circadian clock protein KaiB
VKKKLETATERFERARIAQPKRRYVLRLYISGRTSKSTRALQLIKEVCEEHLRGRYELEVIDIYQEPVLAKDDQILAVPTLIRKLPLPLRKLIGDFSDRERVLLGLDLKPRPGKHGHTP